MFVFVSVCAVCLTVFTSTLILTDTLIWMGNRAFYRRFVCASGGADGCVTFACVCVHVFLRRPACVSLFLHPLCQPLSLPTHTTLPPLLLSSLQLSFNLIISMLLIKATLLHLCTSSANKMHSVFHYLLHVPYCLCFHQTKPDTVIPCDHSITTGCWLFSPPRISFIIHWIAVWRAVLSLLSSSHHLRRCGCDYSLSSPPSPNQRRASGGIIGWHQ